MVEWKLKWKITNKNIHIPMNDLIACEKFKTLVIVKSLKTI